MWIKICGITDTATAQNVASLKPDAIGLNFYDKSPRCVSVDTATAIAKALPAGVEPVGLFVNHSVETIVDVCRVSGISLIQLHGDELPTAMAEIKEAIPAVRIIRAFRISDEELIQLADYLSDCEALGVSPYACLIDARVEGHYGGTGRTAPWDRIGPSAWRDTWPPVILAGGLTEANVVEGIKAVRPWGVDVSSGVESAPAVKDLDRTRRFIENARTCT